MAVQTVVGQVFEDFLSKLGAEPGADPQTIERLREALMVKAEFSVEKLQAALFAEDTIE